MKPLSFNESDLRRFLRLETPTTRALRIVRRALKQLIYLAITFAVLFYLINGAAFWKRLRYSATAAPKTPEVEAPVTPAVIHQPRIIIPKLGLDAPVIYNVALGQILTELEGGVVHFAATAEPGQIGNAVLFGHSSNYPWAAGEYKTVFALLDKLVVGDDIILPYTNQRYRYKVVESKVVRPSEVSVLGKTSFAQLTLITCYPVGTARNRLVIRAELDEGVITGEQTTDPLSSDSIPTPR